MFTLNMARSLSRRSGRFLRESSLVVWSSSFQSLVYREQENFNSPIKKIHSKLKLCRTYLARYVLFITQTGGVGILSSHTVHGMVNLWCSPAVHLEGSSYSLKWMSLYPIINNMT